MGKLLAATAVLACIIASVFGGDVREAEKHQQHHYHYNQAVNEQVGGYDYAPAPTPAAYVTIKSKSEPAYGPPGVTPAPLLNYGAPGVTPAPLLNYGAPEQYGVPAVKKLVAPLPDPNLLAAPLPIGPAPLGYAQAGPAYLYPYSGLPNPYAYGAYSPYANPYLNPYLGLAAAAYSAYGAYGAGAYGAGAYGAGAYGALPAPAPYGLAAPYNGYGLGRYAGYGLPLRAYAANALALKQAHPTPAAYAGYGGYQ